MIISHPILGPIAQEDFSYAALVKDTGTYPVLPSQMWHGGAHVAVDSTGGTQVRAIADGTVLAYRMPTAKPTDSAAAEKHPLSYRGWTDDGFVLIKHEKESGENTKVVFYSLYMHLSKLASRFKGAAGAVQQPSADESLIKRKHQLGELGNVYGKAKSMHFEIFTDESSLNAFFKRGKDNYKVDGKGCGDKDLWGDVHFVIPKDTPYWTEIPETPDCPANKVTKSNLCVTVAYSRSARTGVAENGNRLITTYNEGGIKIDGRSDANFEYEIYKLAQKRFPQNISAGYELLRFGRVIGPDSLPANARNLQEIPLGYGRQGWVDLNRPEIKKLSDADFPYWQWKLITEEGGTFNPNDGKCEPAALLPLMDKNHDGLLAPLEFARFVREEENRKRLSYAICKFPSEWDASDFDKHWDWLKAYFKNPAARDKELAENHKAWLNTVKERLAPLQSNAEQQLKEVKDAHQDVLDDKAALDKSLQENAQKKTELEKKLQEQNKLLDKQQKNKATKPEDISKTNNALFDTDEALMLAIERQGEIKQSIARIAERLEISDRALKLCEETLASIKRDMLKIPEDIKAAEAEIKRTDEELKSQPPNPNSDKLWQEFKAHVTALQFWDKVPGLPNAKQVWHFHPMAFVEHFRKCAWLSKGELAQIYKNDFALQKIDMSATREKYRHALNQVMYKYGVNTPNRMSHFLGQGAHESTHLQVVREMSTAYQFAHKDPSAQPETGGYYADPTDLYGYFLHYERPTNDIGNIERTELRNKKGDVLTVTLGKLSTQAASPAKSEIDSSKSKVGDGMKFRGRGMKQLTGRYNYAQYWVYRGWLDQKSFDRGWERDKNKRAPIITDPERVGNIPFNCIDAAGWYWEAGDSKEKGPPGNRKSFKSINMVITDKYVGDEASTVTGHINRAKLALPKRTEFTKHAYTILGDRTEFDANMKDAQIEIP